MAGVGIKLKKKITYKKAIVEIVKTYSKKYVIKYNKSEKGSGGIGLKYLYSYGL